MEHLRSAFVSNFGIHSRPPHAAPQRDLSINHGCPWFLNRRHLLASAEGRNGLPPRMEAIASFHGRKKVFPAAEGSPCGREKAWSTMVYLRSEGGRLPVYPIWPRVRPRGRFCQGPVLKWGAALFICTRQYSRSVHHGGKGSRV